MSQEDYLYASGVVRHLEKKLLNSTDIERMVDAPDLEAAFKVFHDTDYYDNVLDVGPAEFQQALEADVVQAKERIEEMCPDELVPDLLFLRYDFHNLKLLWKAKLTDGDFNQYLSPLGRTPVENLKSVILNDGKDEISEYCQRAIDHVNERSEKDTVTPALIDRWFDRQYFKEYSKLADKIGGEWLTGLVRLQIDTANIKTWLRGKRLDLPKDYLLSEIIINGNIELAEYQVMLSLTDEEALSRLTAQLSRNEQQAAEQYIESKSLETLERDLENAELEYVRKAQYIDFGPEVPIAYYHAKKNAIRNVRLIMSGKLNSIPVTKIKPLVRAIY